MVALTNNVAHVMPFFMHVPVIGGSISHGHGASNREVTGWVPVFAKWIKKAFSNSTVRNGSIPGTPSVSPCFFAADRFWA